MPNNTSRSIASFFFLGQVAVAIRGRNLLRPQDEFRGTALAYGDRSLEHKPVSSPIYGEEQSPTYEQSYASSLRKEKFTRDCHDYLLSKHVTEDKLVSQNDFADFITEYCQWEKVCDKSETLTFEMLPSTIQLVFAGPICEGEPMCSDEDQELFGYMLDANTYDETERLLTSMCETLYRFIGKYTAPTHGKLEVLISWILRAF